MLLARRVVAAPLRWLAVGLLADIRVLNRAAQGLLIAWAWLRGPDAPRDPGPSAGEGEA